MFRMFKQGPIFAVDSLAYLKCQPADGLFKTWCLLGAEAGQLFSCLSNLRENIQSLKTSVEDGPPEGLTVCFRVNSEPQ